MIRVYKRKKASLDKTKMKAAVLSVRRDNMAIRKAAAIHGVKRATLSDWLKRTTEEQAKNDQVTIINKGYKTIFSPNAEASLSKYLRKSNDIYFGLTTKQVRGLAFDFAQKLALPVPSSWKLCSMAASCKQLN